MSGIMMSKRISSGGCSALAMRRPRSPWLATLTLYRSLSKALISDRLSGVSSTTRMVGLFSPADTAFIEGPAFGLEDQQGAEVIDVRVRGAGHDQIAQRLEVAVGVVAVQVGPPPP